MWWRYTLIVIISVLVGMLIVLLIPKEEESNTQLIENIQELSLKVDSISIKRDTIVQKIDSSKVHLKVIEHWYEKKHNDVAVQSVDSDCVFFREYLSNYK